MPLQIKQIEGPQQSSKHTLNRTKHHYNDDDEDDVVDDDDDDLITIKPWRIVTTKQMLYTWTIVNIAVKWTYNMETWCCIVSTTATTPQPPKNWCFLLFFAFSGFLQPKKGVVSTHATSYCKLPTWPEWPVAPKDFEASSGSSGLHHSVIHRKNMEKVQGNHRKGFKPPGKP